jgi:predicted RNA-binding protein with PIN domain
VQETSMKKIFFFYKKKQKTSFEFFDRFLKELRKKNRSQIMFCVRVSQSDNTESMIATDHVM